MNRCVNFLAPNIFINQKNNLKTQVWDFISNNARLYEANAAILHSKKF
jgi:flagellar assembly factor FliW